jgi:hypothetical protein
MRIIALAVLATLAMTPAYAQQVSPMTGTTSTEPGAPVVTPTRPPAAHRPRMTMQQRFEAANTTKDGKLTLDQAKTAHLIRVVHNFDTMDATKKGFVTMEDIRAYNRAQRAAKKAATVKP